jgi:hypothetical protein
MKSERKGLRLRTGWLSTLTPRASCVAVGTSAARDRAPSKHINDRGPATKSIRTLVVWIGFFLLLTSATGFARDHDRHSSGTLFSKGRIIHSDRTVIHGNIVHYRYDVRVGPGRFDVIRVHRVVRERMPYRPIHTVDGVFLLPGSPNYFEATFMAPLVSSALDWDQSIVTFLAKNNIDVWGLDYGWARVPAETTDFSFMKGWGLARDIHQAEIALSIARRIREANRKGSGTLYLLGFSYGVPIAYSVAGDETQKPYDRRNVKGLIPVDFFMKTNDNDVRSSLCTEAVDVQGAIDAGTYEGNDGVLLKEFSDLAKSAPDEQSPFVPPGFVITNYQFALFVGAVGDPWHFVGGEFNEDGIPTDLLYTKPQVWLDVLQNVPPFYPLQTTLDVDATVCNEVDVPFDDHLGEIALPILYIGAAGGAGGDRGYYTTTLTSSHDITTRLVQLQPDELQAIDYGHADLFFATKPEGNAETLVWQPILNWIKDRAPRGRFRAWSDEAWSRH